ncbi:hypothetical protein R1flu_009084 [Riccia fluitans]|uniref:Uncharacterized protein n=1 Tax=Riccia fluitans TaxID=41844 RepID=A0ABD1Z439_9MARC
MESGKRGTTRKKIQEKNVPWESVSINFPKNGKCNWVGLPGRGKEMEVQVERRVEVPSSLDDELLHLEEWVGSQKPTDVPILVKLPQKKDQSNTQFSLPHTMDSIALLKHW